MAALLGVFLWQQALSPREARHFLLAFGLVPASASEAPLNFTTYAFLHGGWGHIISNIWIFWIFSNNIEDVMGPWRFLLFYLACGVLAGLAHCAANPGSPIPVVGASGAISGVLGAYFLLYPHATITTFVFVAIFRIPAAIYLGGWFVMQAFSALGDGSPGIAWWAHLGGFAAGIIFLPLFRGNRPIPTILTKQAKPRPHDPKDPWGPFRSK